MNISMVCFHDTKVYINYFMYVCSRWRVLFKNSFQINGEKNNLLNFVARNTSEISSKVSKVIMLTYYFHFVMLVFLIHMQHLMNKTHCANAYPSQVTILNLSKSSFERRY